MRTLSIDIESYSSINLAASGVYKYAEAPDFEILLFGYSIDHQPPQVVDLKHGEVIPDEVLRALVDPGVTKSAFNATFERVCLSAYLRKHYPDLLVQSPHNLSHHRHMPAPYLQENPHIPALTAPYSHARAHDAEVITQYPDSVRPSPDMLAGGFLSARSWRCSMVVCAYLGLPQSLEAAARVLGLEVQKDLAGKRLIRKFCTPQAQHSQADALPVVDPDWRAFVEYCRQDVAVEVAIQQRLSAYEIPVSEWDAYVLDQKINDTGILLDLPLVDQAIACDQKHRDKTLQRAKILTGLENPNSPLQLKAWLQEHDCHIETLTKADVAKALKNADGLVREVLMLRGDLAKSSVKKYQAMRNVSGTDKRGRGLIQFYGAGRTGRFAGKLVQVQNLPRNYLPDLTHARALLRSGKHDALGLLYGSVPDSLSQLIRTAFIPTPGYRFVVADFSAIEARVIAWLAGEQWRLDLFKKGGDIYCQSASQMFGVPVEKHGKNADLRQKGKVAELACIAAGQKVLTHVGLVPIEKITLEHRVWDGEKFVAHEGLIDKGVRHVITYCGLTATPDHLVWVQGKPNPIPFGQAAASGAHLLLSGNGGNPIRVGGDHQSSKTLGTQLESLLGRNPLHRMWRYPVDKLKQLTTRCIERLSKLLTKRTPANPQMARPTLNSSEAKMHESQRPWLPQLRGAWYRVPIRLNSPSRAMDSREYTQRRPVFGTRSHRYARPLRTWKSTLCHQKREPGESQDNSVVTLGAKILAVFLPGSDSQALPRTEQSRDYQSCEASGQGQTQTLEAHPSTARVYDIRNAGDHHRYTVSNVLVHNCGYQGSTGALIAMGALDMGLAEGELKPLVDAWRAANPNIVQLWWDVEEAVINAITTRAPQELGCLTFSIESGVLFITLPSSRRLSYVKPRLATNRFGTTSVEYEGVTANKRWGVIESYGGKFTENIVQAIARDLLTHALHTVDAAGHRIVMHVHDEIIIETRSANVEEVCQLMSRIPAWAHGLPLSADGYACDFYMKD